MYGTSVLGILFVSIIVFIFLFLITREFWCWYFKINVRNEELVKTRELLENINKIQIALYKKEFGISTDNKESSGLNSIPESGLKFNHAES
jgi:hypothetical protein